jgi:hypothetical protein
MLPAKQAPLDKKQTAKIRPKVFVLMAAIKPGFRLGVNLFLI